MRPQEPRPKYFRLKYFRTSLDILANSLACPTPPLGQHILSPSTCSIPHPATVQSPAGWTIPAGMLPTAM
jgi:hypothetical protein